MVISEDDGDDAQGGEDLKVAKEGQGKVNFFNISKKYSKGPPQGDQQVFFYSLSKNLWKTKCWYGVFSLNIFERQNVGMGGGEVGG